MKALLLRTPLLVTLSAVVGLMAWVPAVHALVLRDMAVARGFFYGGAVILILSAMMALATAGWRPDNVRRSHLASLFGAYALLPLVMTLPMKQALPDTTLVNAWFEMLSAFTTTGATVYDAARLPQSVHLWRGMMGWFGGYFILMAAFAILAPLNLGGAEVISGRTPGRGATGATQITRVADPSERLARHAFRLLPVYCALTLALWVGLLLAGDPALVALIHAMSTLATSGISPAGGIAGDAAGLVGEVLIFAFLLLPLSRRLVPGAGFGEARYQPLDDPEVRLGLMILLAVPLVLFLRHWLSAAPQGAIGGPVEGAVALWGAVFTTLSFLTTTGFASQAWGAAQGWSGLGSPGLVLMGLAIVGGGAATTAGGVKLLRVYALFRHGERELERIIHPNSVGGQGAQARRLRREGAYMAWVFFMLFAIAIAVVMMLLALTGLGFEPALVLTIAALTTTGQLAEVAGAQPIPYAPLDPVVKAVLGLAMVVGRLETLALLALFTPDGWKRMSRPL